MSTRRTLAVAGIALAGAAALGVGLGRDDGAPVAPPSLLSTFRPSAPVTPPTFAGPEQADAAAPPAADPIAAVRRYLDAEVAGDSAESYDALAAPARAAAGSRARWVEAAPERPRVREYRLDERAVDAAHTGTSTTVSVELDFEPRLDEVAGFVPAVASAEIVAVAEDGGWRVDLDDSSTNAVLPPEEDATAAVARWAESRQRCRPTGEYGGSLLGAPALADALCGTSGPITAAAPERLTDFSGPVVAAFGPGALEWARVVRLDGATRLSVVAAPLGDRWVVVAVGS